jgi:tetratricopeptide (TPR) repeat protein
MDKIPNQDEPRRIEGKSVESEYAIEHPLIGKRSQAPDIYRALGMFFESIMYLQDGDNQKAGELLKKALETDPTLHAHACEALVNMAKSCPPEEEGAIYYWLGIHTQYLEDFPQAETWYTRAGEAFHKIGYLKREGRAHCNLGRIKIKLEDPSAVQEFEKAIELNPSDGIAHIDLGTVYLFADQHEHALDAFAKAVIADAARYGPIVISRLQQYGYTWKEDVEKIGQRVAKNQGMDLDTLTASEREGILQANHYFEIGNNLFQSRRYQEALEQFDMGKSFSSKFPGNFLGVSMTLMQMIEVGVVPKDQIPFYLEKADQNIDVCLRIAPTHQDYLEAKKIIGDYKRKYNVL